jgi:ribosomal protein L20A (L18A)
MSGWSHRRYRNFEKKQERRRKEKKQDTSVRTLAVKHNLDLSKIRVRTLDEIEFD